MRKTWATLVIALLWTLPTAGMFISSWRPEEDIKTSGWWTFFANPRFTVDNYREVLADSGGYFINSLVIAIPSVLFPVFFSALAAYGLTWLRFRGRELLLVLVFALQIVPLQMAVVPLQQLTSHNNVWPYNFANIWLAHTCFALPIGIFLLHGFMSELPAELIEAARVDGASHGRIFRSIMLPLLVPALASLAILQFLWVWNDLFMAMVFAPGEQTAPLTARLAQLSGTTGNNWQLLTAGAFISIAIPLIVFLALQRYFVRGLLAGSVKG